MKRLQKVGLIIGVAVLAIGTMVNIPVQAAVPGANTLINYNSTSTATGTLYGITKAHVSSDGKTVVFPGGTDIDPSSSSNGLYSRNLENGTTMLASVGYMGPVSARPEYFEISSTARFVAFSSTDTNVVSSPVLTQPNRLHLYLRDTLLNTTVIVDTTSAGIPANLTDGASSYPTSVSDDGRFVTFSSNATNLGGPSTALTYFIKDMATGQIIRVAMPNSGTNPNAYAGWNDASCDGSIQVFGSSSTNLTPQDNGNTNTYIADIRNGYKLTNLTYTANNFTRPVSISCNGRYIVVQSNATNLTSDVVDGVKYHIFRYDRFTGGYTLLDKSASGYVHSATNNAGGSMYEGGRIVSDDGRVVFYSNDKNLASPAALYSPEIYIRNPEANTTEIVPVDSSGAERGIGGSTTDLMATLEISADGKSVIYASSAPNLIPGIGSGAGKKLVHSKIN